MKLTAETKSALRALDYEYGGGITTLDAKTDVIDKPILIVGLGGTGVESLIRVKNAIFKHFNVPYSAGGARKPDKPAQVEYMAIDSDDNLVNIKYADMRFNDDEFVLLENANLTSIYRNRETVFKNFTQDWISDSLRLQQVKHGAGGIRQAGRFLLTININKVLTVLTEKINRLTANRSSSDLLYVFILTGCAGGTGSGIFLDIPYIIRTAAEQKGFETENIGMIFMPDVTLSDNMIDGSAALNIKANGFAALKELDYLMNLERSGEYFEQSYGDVSVNANFPPFDLCHLISAKDEAGRLMPSARSYCMNVAAETIINFIASEEVTNGQSYTINSYLSNIENNKTAFLMTHQQKQPVNYIYNTVGASSAMLPMEYLINYLTYKMLSGLNAMFEKNPTMEATQLLLEAMKIDLPYLERLFGDERPKPRDFKQYDAAVLEQRPYILDDAVKSELSRVKDYTDAKTLEVLQGFDAMLLDKNNVLAQHFIDLETGPFYLKKVLSELSDFSLPKAIDELRKRDIAQRREHRDTIAALESRRQTAMEKLKSKSVLSVFNRKGQIDHAVKCNEEYYKAMAKNMIFDAIDQIYELCSSMLVKYHDREVETHCELLTALKELFDKFKNPELKPGSESFTWELASAAELCANVENETDPSMAVDFKNALKKLLKDISANSGWTPGAGNRIVENLNSFATYQFQNVLHKSLDYYCQLLAKSKSVPAEQYIQEKINALNENASVMFPMNHIPNGLHITFPPYGYVSIPSNSPQIRNVVRKMSTSGKISNIKYSRMANRLYTLNLKIAVALYCYKELNEYEAVYESSVNKIAGLHLYENKFKNWKNLPSPNYDRLWTAGYENSRERMKNDHLREIFDKALAYDLIKLDPQTHRLVGRFGDPVDIKKVFGGIEKDVRDKTIQAVQARAAMSEIKAFLASEARSKYSLALFDTEFLPDSNTPDIEYAKGVFIYMPEFNAAVLREIEIREYAEGLLSELKKIDASEVKYSHFAQAVYMGVIYKNRKTYRFMDNEGEKVLYTIENITERYAEYELFQSYLELDAETSEFLQKRARDEENGCSEEQYAQLIVRIAGYIEAYKEKLEQLEKTVFAERESAQKKVFYKEMIEVFTQEKAALV